MMLNNYEGKAVLITGGTKGIGLATGLAFAKIGASVYLTHRWGTVDEEKIVSTFADEGLVAPTIIEADVANEEDTKELLANIARRHDRLEALITNVCFAHISKKTSDRTAKRLARAMEYSSWPFVGYLQAIKGKFGQLPRYSVGMSSRGPEYFFPGYEFVAATKTALEVYCKYLSAELLDEDIRINIIRSNPVSTDSLRATLGEEFEAFSRHYFGDDYFIEPEEVARATVALCSGLMDSVKGQVLLLDRGLGHSDNVSHLFQARERLGLTWPDKNTSSKQ